MVLRTAGFRAVSRSTRTENVHYTRSEGRIAWNSLSGCELVWLEAGRWTRWRRFAREGPAGSAENEPVLPSPSGDDGGRSRFTDLSLGSSGEKPLAAFAGGRLLLAHGVAVSHWPLAPRYTTSIPLSCSGTNSRSAITRSGKVTRSRSSFVPSGSRPAASRARSANISRGRICRPAPT